MISGMRPNPALNQPLGGVLSNQLVAGAATPGLATDEDAAIDQIADVSIRGVLGTVVHRGPRRELPLTTSSVSVCNVA